MRKTHIKRRIDLLEEHIRNPAEKTTVESVSENSFFSYRHANRLFTSIKGESIHSFANKIRIQTSAEYLKYSSKSIFEIALQVGYESTAAFSKAFKKLYGQTPTEFRRTSNLHPEGLKAKEFAYKIEHVNELSVQLFKATIEPASTFEEYFQRTKATVTKLNAKAKQWMLLWGEDPGLCKVSEIRYFIGFDRNEVSAVDNSYGKTIIKGRYAMFDYASLKGFSYEVWHELAAFLVDLDGKQLRQAPYIEWFSDTSLNSRSTFFPDKIAVPIQ